MEEKKKVMWFLTLDFRPYYKFYEITLVDSGNESTQIILKIKQLKVKQKL